MLKFWVQLGSYSNSFPTLKPQGSKACDIFMSSEVEERRQLIKLVLSTLRLDGKNIVYDVQKPFDLIVENEDRKTSPTTLLRATKGILRNLEKLLNFAV